MSKRDSQFKPGRSGNPAGRPKGSKNRLSEDFLFELSKVFQEKGREAIERMADEHPTDFIRCVAGLVPREMMLQVSQKEKVRFVINALPVLSTEEWLKLHGLPITKDSEPVLLENISPVSK